MKDLILKCFDESIETKQKFIDKNLDKLCNIIDVISNCFKYHNKILLMGNGGSASDAQHVAAEFVNKFIIDRPALPAISLATDSSVLTAIGNDSDYSKIFSRQVEALGRNGDICIGLSTSGNSENVLQGIEMAYQKRLRVVAILGFDGGKILEKIKEYDSGIHTTLVVPSFSTPRIQETHILIGHVICEMVERKMFGNLK